jgi:RNA polymerase sigma-70 factor, ECF subfamily
MNQHRDDEKLMRLAAAGKRSAQEAVLLRVVRRLQVVSRAILEHAEDAEDATQSALIQVLRRADTFRGTSSLETWAMRIGAREALRIARQRRLRAARSVAASEFEAAVLNARELSEAIPRDVREYLKELPEALRNALVLRHVCDYTVPEIAELLGVSPNTIKDRLLRARLAVRRKIRREVQLLRRGKVS